jgi:hypothetical protein
MKNFISYATLVIFLIALITTSCKKDPEFVGKWEVQSSHVDRYVNNVFVKDTVETYSPGVLWIEFKDKDSKIGVLHENGASDPFSWSVSGSIITVRFANQCALYLEYTLNEPTLTWTVKTCVEQDRPKAGDTYYEIRTETTKRM